MKILLLGGTGYIGSNIVRARPDWTWHAVGSQELELTDYNCVDQVNDSYDVIINAAGFYGGLVFNTRYQQEILHRNTVIGANVFRLVDKIQPKKFIQLGSGCIYPQDAVDVIDESKIGTGPFHPSVRFSGQAKLGLLQNLQFMLTPWEYLIISNAYGPGEALSQEKSHFVGSLINKIKNNHGQVTMLGTGAGVRDFIYVDDVAEAVCRFCELEQATRQPVNISTGTGTDIRTVTETLLQIANPELQVIWGDAKDNGVMHKVLDNARMRQAIDFQPKTLLEQGLSKTWASFQ
jgi:GDP-L-fucose synthase